jgi:hypothetical protein
MRYKIPLRQFSPYQGRSPAWLEAFWPPDPVVGRERVTIRPANGQRCRDGVVGGRDRGPTTAHGQWTEVEARGVLEAWKKSGHSLEGLRP